MRVIVIGGTGHIGSFLVPRLVEAGHEVINVSRSRRDPYTTHAAWRRVRSEPIERGPADAKGEFGPRIAAMEPDVVIDLICYQPDSARQLVEALRGRVRMLLHCGTIWVHGHSTVVPTTEDRPRHPFGEYGIAKAATEDYLLMEARRNGFPVSIVHPGHVVGPGWPPLNPAGHFNPAVFSRLAEGAEIALPNMGLETVHHVHADDVAQVFMRALDRWSVAMGESFHAVSPGALTLRGYAEAMADWFGKPARLLYLPWDEWRKTASDKEASATWDHIAHSPCCSIEKARRLLDYQPRYTSLEAVQESVRWLMDKGLA